MSRFKTHAWLLIFLLNCFLNNAQTFNFKNYNTEQGLPQSQVLSLFQDHKGYMWFGTNSGGAAKFDGNTFSVFNTNTGLIDNNVFAISENRKNEIVFGISKGLSVYDGTNFRNYSEKDGIKNPLIYTLAIDEDLIWIGTQEGVYCYNNGVKEFSAHPLLSKSSVYSIFVDKKKNVWFGTIQNGIIFYDQKEKTFKEYNIKDQTDYNLVFTITQLQNEDILISCQKGLYRIDKSGGLSRVTEISSSENISFTALLVNKKNEIYYGTQNEGLKLFDFDSNKRVSSYTNINGLTKSPIQCLGKDNEGNLWIGTDGSGVYKYFNDKFVYYNRTSGLTENYVTSVNIDSDNNIWAGLKNSGLVKISKNTIESFSFDVKHSNELPDNTINSILPLDNGNMLFGTTDGLCIYDGKKFKAIAENDFRHQYITSLYRDSRNSVWIGTNEGLFKLINNAPEEVVELKKYKEEGFQFPINFITEDINGSIWIGSNNNLFSLNKNGAKKHSEKDNLTGYVFSGVIDSKNNIWLGTESGLYLFKDEQFISISKSNNYQASFINFVQLGKENKLYVGTNNGIDIIDVNKFYRNEFSYKHLGKDDGLLSLESNFNASVIDRSESF